MKFLLLTQYFPPEVGAAQTRLAAVTKSMRMAGHEVEVVTAMPNYPVGRIQDGYRGRLASTSVHDGIRVHRVWMYAALGTGTKRLISYLSFAITSLLGIVRVRRPDAIVIESPPLFLAVTGILYAKLRRIPAVLNVADLWPDAAVALGALQEGPVLRTMLAIERWAYRNATIVSTVTLGLRERLVRDKAVSPERIVMLANGVDTELFRPEGGDIDMVARLDLPAGDFLIYAGTIGLAHGLDPLLDAMKTLSSQAGAPYLLMLGSGSERTRLIQRAKDEGIRNVEFREPVPLPDLATILPLALIGVVTLAEIPLNDSCRPAKLYPLMAAGLPVLFAGRGEGAEIIIRADCGVVVSNRADEIVIAINSLCADADARKRMAGNAREAVEQTWSWERQTAAWLEAIDGIVKARA